MKKNTNSDLVETLRADQSARWRRGETITVEAYLADQPALKEDTDGVLELIYNEVLEREERGESPRLTEYQQRFPWLAGELAPLFELHAGLATTRVPTSNGAASPAGALPTLAGYETLRELGRGGVGVVYLARHVRLNRLVAIKAVSAGIYADPAALERLRHEATILAQLGHPHFVQIYEIGEHDGLPFLALEFVSGGSLAEHLTGTPQSIRDSAALMEILARAIHGAHQQGIVHRDLKPANILMSRIEGRGSRVEDREGKDCFLQPAKLDLRDWTPKITDFGLAKLIEQEGAGSVSGQPIGTPCYMPPEQAQGERKSIGPAADVYSLGAILYELLTGRPPFRAETMMDTLQQVLTLEPVSPGQLRPGLPRDLETICLKCLRKNPRQRYASALELAEDLRHFLAGEPVKARPVGVLERGRRWVKRRPAVAALLAVSAAAVLGLLGLSAWIAITLHEYNLNLQGETERAERSREEAEANLGEALELLKTILDTEKGLADISGTEGQWRRLLEKALASYETILRRYPASPLVPARAGRAYERLGFMLYLLGDMAAAERAYRRALELQGDLVAQYPENPDYRSDLAATWNGLGNLLRHVGPPHAATEAFEQAIQHQRQLTQQWPAVAAYQHNLATSYHNLAHRVRDRGSRAEAGKLYHKAEMLEAALVRLDPTATENQYGWAMALQNHGLIEADTDLAEGVTMCNQAATILEKILAGPRYQSIPGYEHGLAEVDHNLAKLLLRRAAEEKHLGRALSLRAEARKRYDKALDLHASLLARFPLVPRYRREQARHYHARGLLLAGALNQCPEGLADLTQALTSYGLLHDFPSPHVHQFDLGIVKSDLGQLLLKSPADTSRALALLEQATGHLRAAFKIEPARDATRRRLIRDYRTLARSWLKQGRVAEAAAAATNLAEVAADSPADLYEAARLLTACTDLTKNTLSAEAWARQAVSLLEKIVRQNYTTPGRLADDPTLAPLRSRSDFQKLAAMGKG